MNNLTSNPRVLGFSLVFAPWLLVAGLLWARWTLPADRFRQVFMGEQGPVELGTVVLLVIAVVAGIQVIRRRKTLPAAWLRWWTVALVVGCVYFAGEEISWGQHLFGWDTPAPLAGLNDQGETNLHNMSSWLDQKPRLGLELWVVVGTVIALLRWRRKEHPQPDNAWHWFWPWPLAASTGLCVALVRMPERLEPLLGPPQNPFDIRLAEVQELLLGLYLLLYLAALLVRVKRVEVNRSPDQR
ncbi:MAG: hypothetical protein QNJ40_22350 [Xanthomonadales bacterium]|nr:hypothetical protein [Xanthomonadales bacterium]